MSFFYPPGHFHVVSEQNPRLALDVRGANFSQGNDLIVWDLQLGKINQLFKFNPNGSISCVGAPNLVIDVRGGANQGADIILWQDHNGENQKWNIHPDDSIRLQGMANLAIDIQGGNANQGTKVIAWQHHGGEFHIVSEMNPGLAMDVRGENYSQGNDILVWNFQHGKQNQKFRFNSNGSITPSSAPNLVLDVRGGANQGADIILWQDHNGENQRWHYHSNGSIVLLGGSNLAMDIQGGNGSPGTKIIAWPHHGGANQRWRLVNV
jgi:hypothetical protein